MSSPVVNFSKKGQSDILYSCPLNEITWEAVYKAFGLGDGDYAEVFYLSDVEYKETGHLCIFDIEIESDPGVTEGIYEYVKSEEGYYNLIGILTEISYMRRDYAYVTANRSDWFADNPYVTYFPNRYFTERSIHSSRYIFLKEGDDCVDIIIDGFTRGRFRIINSIPLTLDTLVSAVNDYGLLYLHEGAPDPKNAAKVTNEYTVFHFENAENHGSIFERIILSLNKYIEGKSRKKSARK